MGREKSPTTPALKDTVYSVSRKEPPTPFEWKRGRQHSVTFGDGEGFARETPPAPIGVEVSGPEAAYSQKTREQPIYLELGVAEVSRW